MTIKTILPLGAAALMLAGCGGAGDDAAPDAVAMEPGLYTAQVELVDLSSEGASDEQIERMREAFTEAVSAGHSYCLAAEDPQDSGQELARSLANGNCEMQSYTYEGDQLDAQMSCTLNDGGSSSTGMVAVRGTVQEAGSDMTMTMDQRFPAAEGADEMNVQMTVRLDSQRTGDCAADEQAAG